jgi:GNAT superfamily N-acetyltransferase
MLAGMRVRCVTLDELGRLRDLRLRALADSPGAFGARYEDEAQRPVSEWVRWVSEGSTFVLDDDGEWFGLAALFANRDDDSGVNLVSMWVDPRRRGQGLGSFLLQSVIDVASTRDAKFLELGVVEGNDVAYRMYERAGFGVTGRTEPLRSDPTRTVTFMRLDVPR